MILKTGWAEDPQQRMVQRLMLYGIPLSLLVSGSIFPIGVIIYWVTNNLFSLGQQQWVLRKFPPLVTNKGVAGNKATTPTGRGPVQPAKTGGCLNRKQARRAGAGQAGRAEGRRAEAGRQAGQPEEGPGQAPGLTPPGRRRDDRRRPPGAAQPPERSAPAPEPSAPRADTGEMPVRAVPATEPAPVPPVARETSGPDGPAELSTEMTP